MHILKPFSGLEGGDAVRLVKIAKDDRGHFAPISGEALYTPSPPQQAVPAENKTAAASLNKKHVLARFRGVSAGFNLVSCLTTLLCVTLLSVSCGNSAGGDSGGTPAAPPVPPPPPRDAGVYVGTAINPEPNTAALPSALAWLTANAINSGVYTVVINQNTSLPSTTLAFNEKNVHITLEGETTTRTVQLAGTGALFEIQKNVTLKLGNGVKLQGVSSNTGPLLNVTAGGKLEVGTGAIVTGNKHADGDGGGIAAAGSAVCIISGGEISDNGAARGGGVFINGLSARFEMSNGVVRGNRTTSGGTGLFIRESATGLISGGEIRDNIASGTKEKSGGAGLRITTEAVVTMTGGTITGNKIQNTNGGGGGGVFIGNEKTRLVFRGGTIANNETNAPGSAATNNLYRELGVFVNESGQTLTAANGFVF